MSAEWERERQRLYKLLLQSLALIDKLEATGDSQCVLEKAKMRHKRRLGKLGRLVSQPTGKAVSADGVPRE
jgi:hypothetical protein